MEERSVDRMKLDTYGSRSTVNRLRLANALYLLGIVGCAQFIATFLIEGATRPGYNSVQDAVSTLSLSDAGIVDIVSLVVIGVLLIAMSFAIGWAWAPDMRFSWESVVIALVGVGFMCAGIFVTDPAQGYPPGTPNGPAASTTLHGTLHFALGVPLVFGGLTAAGLIFARHFWVDGMKAWAVYSVVSAIGVIGGLVGFVVLVNIGGPGGLLERMSFVVGLLWVALLAIESSRRLRSSSNTAHAS